MGAAALMNVFGILGKTIVGITVGLWFVNLPSPLVSAMETMTMATGKVFFYDREGINWYRWNGGECPTHCHIDVIFSDGSLFESVVLERDCSWEHLKNSNTNIVAYCIMEEL